MSMPEVQPRCVTSCRLCRRARAPEVEVAAEKIASTTTPARQCDSKASARGSDTGTSLRCRRIRVQRGEFAEAFSLVTPAATWPCTAAAARVRRKASRSGAGRSSGKLISSLPLLFVSLAVSSAVCVRDTDGGPRCERVSRKG